ncbi:sensor histidine kinase [Halosimplex pelagicum]|uniref:histidine kinase n=1 Tax=Halosimplex pelagicum TaxID=869886 RepID=A0A7D5T461_9EURY|nr:HAMP domain-containing sensor histidine kinase [Halosimplex pelagicum]QLH82411.1 HAMP domain-containing histidine kinase [Halosimplex pelagicum]
MTIPLSLEPSVKFVRWGSAPIALFGVLHLVAGGLVFTFSLRSSTIHVIFSFLPGTLIIAGWYWAAQNDLPSDRYIRIVGWMVGTAAGLALVPVLLIISPAITIDAPVFGLLAAIGVGGFGGLLAGVNEASAIERAREAERERLDREYAERQREQLEHVNHLLRHDILNNVNVIQGRTELLLADADGEEAAQLDTIDRQAGEITELIQNVRAYLHAIQNDEETLKPIHLSTVLEQEVTTIKTAYPDVGVDTDIPATGRVRADDLLSSVFRNLLRNAVVHNTSSRPRIAVSATVHDDTVVVRVTDNGPGLPSPVREQLFEASDQGDHGFGLYLVKTLTEQYGGSVHIESTGEDGTTFAVELQPVDTATQGVQ